VQAWNLVNGFPIHLVSLTDLSLQGKGSNCTAKVLGIHWDPEEDMLSYKVCLTTNPHNTKRQVLSDVARIFDPLGILSPVVVQFKILFQELFHFELHGFSDVSIKAYSAVIYNIAEWFEQMAPYSVSS